MRVLLKRRRRRQPYRIRDRRWLARNGRSSKLKSLFGSEAEATERSRTKSFAYQAPKQPKAEAKKGACGICGFRTVIATVVAAALILTWELAYLVGERAAQSPNK